jgi:thioredoxin reductase (NADPH)
MRLALLARRDRAPRVAPRVRGSRPARAQPVAKCDELPGLPDGISGSDLTRNATLQARRFDAVLSSFHRAVEQADGPEGLVRVGLDDGQHVLARSVVMAIGARWRELQAEGVDRFRGAGVYHAAMSTDAERSRDQDVIVVGGGN